MKRTKKLLVVLSLLMLCAMPMLFVGCDKKKEEPQKMVYNIIYVVDNKVHSIVPRDDINSIVLPEEPTKVGYAFKGWYLDEKFEKAFISAAYLNKEQTDHMCVYAKFEELTAELPNSINVCYHLNGGVNAENNKNIMYFDNNQKIILDCPTKEGFGFAGWYLNEDLTIKWNGGVCLDGNKDGYHCLYAKWTEDYETNGHIFVKLNNKELTAFEIPYGIKIIKGSAFRECNKLTNVVIPESVTTIENSAFYACRGLVSIVIPKNVETIGFGVFYNCSSLENIVVSEENVVYDSRNNCNAIIETSRNRLIVGCKNTIIPQSVTIIADGAFFECDGLENIVIPEGVLTIENDAFYSCSNLMNLKIPASVTSLSWGSFRFCGKLESIIVAEGNAVYDSRNNCNAIIETDTNHLIRGCKNTIIPYGIESLGLWAFSSCVDLTTLAVPTSVTSFGMYVFSDCIKLNTLILYKGVKNIGQHVFTGSSITEIIFKGTQEEWNAISIDESNTKLLDGSITIKFEPEE